MVLAKMGMQNIRNIARAALYIHSFAYIDSQILEMFYKIFDRMKTSTSFLLGPKFFHMVIQSTSKRRKINPFNISTPSTFQCMLLLHSVSLPSALLVHSKT